MSGEEVGLRQPEETEIAEALDTLCPGLDYWLHEDDDSTPWMMVSRDIVRGGGIVAVPRVDIDTNGAKGGLSPAHLNWDDGVRALDAGVDTTGPHGFEQPRSAELIGQLASWFHATGHSFA